LYVFTAVVLVILLLFGVARCQSFWSADEEASMMKFTWNVGLLCACLPMCWGHLVPCEPLSPPSRWQHVYVFFVVCFSRGRDGPGRGYGKLLLA